MYTYILWQAAAAPTFNSGNTYIINLNSLCGKNENNATNIIAGTVSTRTLASQNIPKGIRKYENARPLGNAE